MRIAVLIIGLVLTFGLFIQAFLVYGLSGAFDQEESAQAGAVGVLMALMWLISCGLVIPLPRAAMTLFAIAGLLGFAASGDFPDLAIWGGASLALAVMSYFGFRGKRKAERKEAERDAMMRELLQHREATAAAPAGLVRPVEAPASFALAPPGELSAPISFCPQCGSQASPVARFCPNCGASLLPLAVEGRGEGE